MVSTRFNVTTGGGLRPCTCPRKVAVRQQLTCAPSPLQLTADCGTVCIDRRRDGAGGWCGGTQSVQCVVNNFLGRNETIWVHVRNGLHTCNRTQVKPAPTDPRWSGIGYKSFLRTCVVEDSNTVQTSLKTRNLTEDEKMGPDECVPDVRLGHAHSQSEPDRTTILEASVVERSSQSLIVPEPEEHRQHRHGKFDQKGTASVVWDGHYPDLETGLQQG